MFAKFGSFIRLNRFPRSFTNKDDIKGLTSAKLHVSRFFSKPVETKR